ncbi:MAG: efflux RND transporter periplasmic adaptor subunit [Desulfobulbaceae bacterium]
MTPPARDSATGRRPRFVVRRIILVLLILLLGIGGGVLLVKTRPKVTRRPPAKVPPLVVVTSLHPSTEIVRVEAMGTVEPARRITLKAPVGGEIVEAGENFVPGGFFAEGSPILRIDPVDYELALQQKKRSLAEARFALRLEEGRQEVARREWELLQGDGKSTAESDLALRKPHLEKARADLEAAGAEVELAQRNLDRTSVTAPFNSLVLERYVDRGSYVGIQEKLAELVGTDEYWVRVALPMEDLDRLKIPGINTSTGSAAEIHSSRGWVRSGQVIRLLGDLAAEGRMARLLVSIPDPLGQRGGDAAPVLIGEYVRVALEGETLADVFSIPRTAFHNNREVWIVNEQGLLEVRPVETVWRSETRVLVREGLQEGEQLVISSLTAPVDGMEVRVASSTAGGE